MMELKPCPFCGKSETEQTDYCVCQSDIMLAMPRFKWNNRPIEDALQQRIDELEAENKRLREALGKILNNRGNSGHDLIPFEVRKMENIAREALQ